jgi:hypothetical protein
VADCCIFLLSLGGLVSLIQGVFELFNGVQNPEARVLPILELTLHESLNFLPVHLLDEGEIIAWYLIFYIRTAHHHFVVRVRLL